MDATFVPADTKHTQPAFAPSPFNAPHDHILHFSSHFHKNSSADS